MWSPVFFNTLQMLNYFLIEPLSLLYSWLIFGGITQLPFYIFSFGIWFLNFGFNNIILMQYICTVRKQVKRELACDMVDKVTWYSQQRSEKEVSVYTPRSVQFFTSWDPLIRSIEGRMIAGTVGPIHFLTILSILIDIILYFLVRNQHLK